MLFKQQVLELTPLVFVVGDFANLCRRLGLFKKNDDNKILQFRIKHYDFLPLRKMPEILKCCLLGFVGLFKRGHF